MSLEITEERLRHAILQMAELTGEKSFVVIGRATLAITAPPHLRNFARTNDIDMWPRDNEQAALDQSIEMLGEESEFYRRNGFYIERVGSWTLMTQPAGWEDRAVKIVVGENVLALVLGLLDLGYNKLEAFRDKDRKFLAEAFTQRLLNPDELRRFIQNSAPSAHAKITLLKNLASLLPQDRS